MKNYYFRCLNLWFLAVLTGLMVFAVSLRVQAGNPPRFRTEYTPTNGEFDMFGKAVVELLKTHSTGAFATNFSVSAGDWHSLITTNSSDEDANKINEYAKGGNYGFKHLKSGAQDFLKKSDALHLDFSGGDLNYRILPPKFCGQIYYGGPTNKEMTMPYLEKLEVALFRGAEPDPQGKNSFKVALRGLEKFPTGWRLNNSEADIQWTSFPTNVADPDTLRELAMSEKMASHEPITSEDDPSLLKLGELLVQFVHDHDTNAYKTNLLLDGDTVWAMYKKIGGPGPTRQQLDEEIGKRTQEQLAVAGKLIEMMNTTGIDLKDAGIKIKDARMEHCQSAGPAAGLLMGERFSLFLTVTTDARAANGVSLSGDYVLGAKQIIKLGSDWKVEEDVHWEKLPAGITDARTVANIEFENYVAEHRALPQGTAAPDIEFTTIVGQKKMKLSDLRDKVVILDFWATDCGPCQQPLADLQKVRKDHPDWQDKVAIIPVSIDDTLDAARKHLNKHGWTNTFNVWAGEGGWHSGAAQKFRVTGIPTTYVIDRKGTIAWSGSPELEDIASIVDVELKK